MMADKTHMEIAVDPDSTSEELWKAWKSTPSPKVKKQILKHPAVSSEILADACRLYPEEIVENPTFQLYEMFGDSDSDRLLRIIREMYDSGKFGDRYELISAIQRSSGLKLRDACNLANKITTIVLASPNFNYSDFCNLFDSTNAETGVEYLERIRKNKLLFKKLSPYVERYVSESKNSHKLIKFLTAGLISPKVFNEKHKVFNEKHKHTTNYDPILMFTQKVTEDRLTSQQFDKFSSYLKTTYEELTVELENPNEVDKYNKLNSLLFNEKTFEISEFRKIYSHTLAFSEKSYYPSISYWQYSAALRKLRDSLLLKRTTNEEKEEIFESFSWLTAGSTSSYFGVQSKNRLFAHLLGFKTDADYKKIYTEYLYWLKNLIGGRKVLLEMVSSAIFLTLVEYAIHLYANSIRNYYDPSKTLPPHILEKMSKFNNIMEYIALSREVLH